MTTPSHADLAARALRFAEKLTADIRAGSDWPNTPEELGRMNAAMYIRDLAAALESPERVQGEAITAEELQLFEQTIEEFCDCGETSTPYETLMKWANRGWLECEHFVSTAEGNRVLEGIAPPLFAESDSTPPTAPDQDAQGVSAILDALRVGRVACEWAEKTAEVQQIAAAMEIAKSMLSATPPPQAEKQPLSDEQITKCWERMGRGLGKYTTFARAIERAHGIVTKEST